MLEVICALWYSVNLCVILLLGGYRGLGLLLIYVAFFNCHFHDEKFLLYFFELEWNE